MIKKTRRGRPTNSEIGYKKIEKKVAYIQTRFAQNVEIYFPPGFNKKTQRIIVFFTEIDRDGLKEMWYNGCQYENGQAIQLIDDRESKYVLTMIKRLCDKENITNNLKTYDISVAQ